MKRIKLISIILTSALITSFLSACSSGGQTATTAPVTETTTEAVTTAAETEKPAETEAPATESEKPTETSVAEPEVFKGSQIKVLGRLYQLEKSGTPTVKAVTVTTVPTGNTQEINRLPALSDGIRCIYDLESYIIINPTCPFDESMSVTIVPHQNKTSYYNKNFLKKKARKYGKFDLCSDDTGYATTTIRLDKKVLKPGYYDMVFLKGKMPVAVVMIKIYAKGGIEKAGADAKELMNQEIEKTKK